MKKTLAVLAGGVLVLVAGCSSSTPGPAPAAEKSSEVVAEETDASAQEEVKEGAALELGEAYDQFVIAYNEGIENGDDVLEADPSASLDGFSQQRDALYDFDAAIRDIEFPDEMVRDVNGYLEKLAEHIAVLDQINEAETVGELDTLYDVDLREARDEEIAALDPILKELEIDLEETEEEAPTIGGGGSGGGSGESGSGPGSGGETIEDAEAVSQTLRDAATIGSGMVETEFGAFPEEWMPYTQQWTFAGSANEPDPQTIIGNTIVVDKNTGESYILLAIEDTAGRCEALALTYGEDEKVFTKRSKSVSGECTYEAAASTLGF